MNESICSVLEKSDNEVQVKKFENLNELEKYRLSILDQIVKAVNVKGKHKELKDFNSFGGDGAFQQ